MKERLKLNPADTKGYTLTQEEKNIIKQENKYNSRQNLIDLPELQLSEKEHEEIAYRTVGRVIDKLV